MSAVLVSTVVLASSAVASDKSYYASVTKSLTGSGSIKYEAESSWTTLSGSGDIDDTSTLSLSAGVLRDNGRMGLFYSNVELDDVKVSGFGIEGIWQPKSFYMNWGVGLYNTSDITYALSKPSSGLGFQLGLGYMAQIGDTFEVGGGYQYSWIFWEDKITYGWTERMATSQGELMLKAAMKF